MLIVSREPGGSLGQRDLTVPPRLSQPAGWEFDPEFRRTVADDEESSGISQVPSPVGSTRRALASDVALAEHDPGIEQPARPGLQAFDLRGGDRLGAQQEPCQPFKADMR
jgi:hypothetical protein